MKIQTMTYPKRHGIVRRLLKTGAMVCSSAAVFCASGMSVQSAIAQQHADHQNLQAMQLEFPQQSLAQQVEQQQSYASEQTRQHAQVSYLNPAISKSSRRLSHVTWQQFEEKLVELWGQHLQAQAEDSEGRRIRIWIPSIDGTENQLVIDREHAAVTFEGAHHSAENWDALMTVLDQPANSDNGTIRLVGLDSAEPSTVRRAVALLGLSEDSSGPLGETLQFQPYRNTARIAAAPQRRTPLNSIPFRPSKAAAPKALQPQLHPRQPKMPTKNTSSYAQPSAKQPVSAPPSGLLPRKNPPKFVKPKTPIPTNSNAPVAKTPTQANAATIVPQPGRTPPVTSTMPRPRQPMARRPVTGQSTQPVTPTQTKLSNSALPFRSNRSPAAAPAQLTNNNRENSGNVITAISMNQENQDEGENQIIELPPQESLEGNVKIRVLEDMRTIVLVGQPEDVAKVRKLIEQLKASSNQVQAKSEIYPLTYVDSEQVKAIVDQAYEAIYETDNGAAEVTAIDSPNAVLVIGQEGAQTVISDLIKKLDIAPPKQVEGQPPQTMDHKIYRLQYMSAIDMAQRLQGYFRQDGGGGNTGFGAGQTTIQPQEWIAATEGPVSIIPDYRSNSLIVKGNARVLATVDRLLSELDVAEATGAKHVVRFFNVNNTLASDLAIVLQAAINGQLQGAPQAFTNDQNQNQNQNFNNNQNQQGTLSRLPTAVLELATIDGGNEKIQSGILFDVKVTADNNSNKLMVTGPAESMDLVAALVEQLDQIPDAETLIKVFTIVNGDATQLLTTLQSIFGADQATQNFNNTGNNTNNFPLQTASATQGSSLINLRFAVEARTNSIIVSGPEGDLLVVEDLLLRLDEEDLSSRVNRVYRLKNAPAEDAATAINQWLEDRQAVFDADPTTSSAFESARRQVVVVPELVSNSLLISATPAYYEELIRLIEDLDRRPPMVKVKVMIAEVDLDKLSEFGIEVGIQDSLLFDRGLGVIGFPFNQAGIGNNSDALSLATRELLAGQALSNLNIGRTNTDLGYGGLVLTAGNESINVLMRALQNRSIARILNTPEISSIDNLQGSIQVGENVPRITDATQNTFGGINLAVEDVSVGVILNVTPRVTPDGMIIMNVDAINSSLGEEENGVPVFVNDGQVIRSPIINITQAQTTIMARNGQTVVFSGLIQDAIVDSKRGTPILSDLPVIGPLFSFEQKVRARSELLIVLTPYIVENDEQLEASNAASMARMHWCEQDVRDIYGRIHNYEFDPERPNGAVPAIYYPDDDPTGTNPVYVPLEGPQGGQPPTPEDTPAPVQPNEFTPQGAVPNQVSGDQLGATQLQDNRALKTEAGLAQAQDLQRQLAELKSEREKLEQLRREQQLFEQQKLEQVRLAQEQAEQERLNQERLAQQQVAQRQEQERLTKIREMHLEAAREQATREQEARNLVRQELLDPVQEQSPSQLSQQNVPTIGAPVGSAATARTTYPTPLVQPTQADRAAANADRGTPLPPTQLAPRHTQPRDMRAQVAAITPTSGTQGRDRRYLPLDSSSPTADPEKTTAIPPATRVAEMPNAAKLPPFNPTNVKQPAQADNKQDGSKIRRLPNVSYAPESKPVGDNGLKVKNPFFDK